MKKSILIMIVLAMCLLTITACGQPKIVGVKSLVAANASAQAKVKNYHIDGTMNLDVTLDSEELEDLPGSENLKLPVTMTMTADAGQDTAHATTEASVSLFGETVPLETAELYMDIKNKVSYAKAGQSQEWTKTDYQDQQMNVMEMAGGLATFGKTVLESASYQESDEVYSLSMPAETAGDFVADLNLLDNVDVGIANFQDITVEGGEIIYNVDKETLLVSSIELKDVNIRGKGVYEDASVFLKIPLNAEFQFSRYNELEESEYAIPEEVKAAAE